MLLIAMRNPLQWWVVFHKAMWADVSDAANLAPSQPREGIIMKLASILRRIPQAKVEVHSHIAMGNPYSIAGSITHKRAERVRRELERHGVHASRVSLSGWGDEIAMRSNWRMRDSARSELFVVLDGAHFPCRPRVYNTLTPLVFEPWGEASLFPASGGDAGAGEEPTLRSAPVSALRRALRRLFA